MDSQPETLRPRPSWRPAHPLKYYAGVNKHWHWPDMGTVAWTIALLAASWFVYWSLK